MTQPAVRSDVLESAPVHLFGAESVHDAEPCRGSIFSGVARVRVEPVLERIDHRHPWEQADDTFEVLDASAGDLIRVLVEDIEVRGAQQFHRHRGDLAEFDRGTTVGNQLVVAGLDAVESVPTLVEQRLDISLLSGSVHEDEGNPDLLEVVLVAAGCLVLAGIEIEQFAIDQQTEHLLKIRVNLAKDLTAPIDQVRIALERAKRWPSLRVDRCIPGPQSIQPESLATPGGAFLDKR